MIEESIKIQRGSNVHWYQIEEILKNEKFYGLCF